MKRSYSLAEKKLRDGTTLKLIEHKNAPQRYQLNLVDGIIMYQFPTTERLNEEHVRSIYDSVNSSNDFQRVLKSYGQSGFFAAQSRRFSKKNQNSEKQQNRKL